MKAPPLVIEIRPTIADAMDDGEYRRICGLIYQRAGSWRKLAALLLSDYSPAWWNLFMNGRIQLTHRAKNELRRASGLSDLPRTLADLAVQLGGDTAVNLVATPPQDANVSPLTPPGRRAATKAIRLHPDLWQRLNLRRRQLGQTWNEYESMLYEIGPAGD